MADSKFVVRQAVAIPAQRRGRKPTDVTSDYPFQDMAIGDSFVVAGKKNIQKCRNASQLFVKEHGGADGPWRFQTRDISGMPNGQGGVYEPETYGVWRVLTTVEPAHHEEPTVEPVPILTVNPE